jgi:ligand-binding sensor domain-containing protein
LSVALVALPSAAAESPAGDPPLFVQWRSFGTADGLPSDTIFALAVEPGRVWVGTDKGLARYQDGRWTSWGTADGLPYAVITSLAVDPATGDLWVGTMGGLARFSGGRFESFTQRTSGLANDVVYGVAVDDHYVWAATAAGASRYDTWTGRWQIFTNRNAPMHEIWCYGVSAGPKDVYLAVWGGGVLRFDRAHQRWREFRDPDGQMELDLLRDDGPVSDVVASVSQGPDGLVWAGTYFGVNRFDGRTWSSWSKTDSGLVSDFVSSVLAEGRGAWFATDSGLAYFDGTTWVTYRAAHERVSEGKPPLTLREGERERTVPTHGSLPDDYVLAVARRGDELWVGTEHGLGLGLPARPATTPEPTPTRGATHGSAH